MVRRSASTGYDVINDACLDLVAVRPPASRASGAVRDFRSRFARSPTSVAPVDRSESPVAGRFSVALAQTFEVPTPFEQAFEVNGDRETYAAALHGAIRAITEPVIAAKLIGLAKGNRLLLGDLYDGIHALHRRRA